MDFHDKDFVFLYKMERKSLVCNKSQKIRHQRFNFQKKCTFYKITRVFNFSLDFNSNFDNHFTINGSFLVFSIYIKK